MNFGLATLVRKRHLDLYVHLFKQTKRENGKDFPAGDFAYVPDRSTPST